MSSDNQQFLTPDNMTMIDRARAKVRSLRGLKAKSAEDEHIASVMIHQFQKGNVTEDGLVDVFLRAGKLNEKHKQQMQEALSRWDDEGGAHSRQGEREVHPGV